MVGNIQPLLFNSSVFHNSKSETILFIYQYVNTSLTKPGDMGHIWSKYGNGMT